MMNINQEKENNTPSEVVRERMTGPIRDNRSGNEVSDKARVSIARPIRHHRIDQSSFDQSSFTGPVMLYRTI